jgi:hypothetical protein
MRRNICVVLLLVLAPLLTACGERVPVEVKTAMEKQAAELQQIRTSYKSSVDALFGQIRVLQIAILAEQEERIRRKYTVGPQVVNGNVLYYDATGKPFPPTGDPSVDMIPESKQKAISAFFDKLRADSEKQLQDLKEEFMKLDDHVQVAQQINVAVSDYVTSLVNARKAQRELGNNLISKLGGVGFAGGFPGKILNLLVPDTKPLETSLPTTK